MFAPRYLRHIIGNLQILGEESDGDHQGARELRRAAGAVRSPDAKLHQVGVYHDVFRRVDGAAQARRAPLRLRQPAGANALCLPV